MVQVENGQKSTIGTMIAAGLIMVLCYFHMISWGKYAGSIIPLKIKTVSGLASAGDYHRLAEACAETGKYDCATQAYLYEFQTSRDAEVVGQLAAFQLKTENYKAAADTFVKYYQLNGKNSDYAYFYGQTLEKLGQKERAERAYQLSIDQNPTKLSINATTALVRLYMSEGKMKKAHQVITAFKASAENAASYLNDEEKIINKKLGVTSASPTRQVASIKTRRKGVVKF